MYNNNIKAELYYEVQIMSHVLISGGSRGIGASIVKKFITKNFKVTYLYNSNKGNDSNCLAIQCDVSNPEAVKRAVKQAVSINGDIDVLVSNSGISVVGLATDFDFDTYHKVMDTNFGGFFNLTKEVIPQMVHNQNGSIIAISSMWGQTGASCEALYSASKGAIDSYVKSLAKELGPSNIRVNAVSPGVIMTDMLNSFTKEDLDSLSEETPLSRIGEASDIANTVFYLSSTESSFITGQIIGVNGGFLI